jgi:hypothetical protein
MNSDVYNYSHSLLVLLPSTHTFQVYAQPNKHFATCTSFIYKQFTFRVYLTLHFHKSVSVVVSVLCVSSHKHLMCQWSKVMFYSSRPFVSPITSFTWTTPPLPLPTVEILRPWGRKVHLQCRVMMFFVDYSSSSHQKLNHRTGRLRPVTSRAHVRPPFTRSASRPLRVHL